MGFFRSNSRSKPPKPASIPRGGTAAFTPVGEATFTPVGEAEFTLVTDELATPTESEVQETLTRTGASEEENAYLSGEVVYVQSSNVSWIQYLWRYPGPNGQPLAGPEQNEMFIGYHDGSVYQYEQIDFDLALQMYRAGSKGKAVWDNLRVRGTVFGYQKPYRLVSGNRLWDTTEASRARHEAIGKSGEEFAGYHPLYNYAGASGRAGATGINLGKKGSKKIAYFTPTRAKTAHSPKKK